MIAAAIVLLTVTGIYIGQPYLAPPTGEAGRHFVMGWMRVLHMYGGIAFTTAVVVRILWMFVGTRWSSFLQLIPLQRHRFREIWETQLFWMLIRRNGPELIGHNPIGGLMYTAMYAMYVIMALTGFALWGASADQTWYHHFTGLLPFMFGLQGARIIHHVVMWLILLCVVVHLYSAVLASISERNGEIDSIFSGYKWVRKPKARG